MKNKTKKILVGACLGLVGMGCLTGCEKKQDYYELTVINDSQYGIISPVLDNETNSVTVDRGDDYTFTITPREGYEIDNLIIDGLLVEPQSIYTFTDIKSDHSIGAIYTKKIKSFNVLAIKFDAYYKNPENYNANGNNENIIQLSLFQIDNFKGMQESSNEVKIADFEEISIDVCKDYEHANSGTPISGNKIEAQLVNPIKCNLYDEYEMLEIGSKTQVQGLETVSIDLVDFNRKKQLDIPNFYFDDNQYIIELDQEVRGYTVDGIALVFCNISLICEANYY